MPIKDNRLQYFKLQQSLIYLKEYFLKTWDFFLSALKAHVHSSALADNSYK